MHSAGHLIGHFIQAMGWTPIKAHHWPDEGRVQFKPAEGAQEVDAQSVQYGIDQWIEHDLPRLTSLREGAREIGFGELPAYGCGGTHVRSLKDLGTVTIASLSQKKGTLVGPLQRGLSISGGAARIARRRGTAFAGSVDYR